MNQRSFLPQAPDRAPTHKITPVIVFRRWFVHPIQFCVRIDFYDCHLASAILAPGNKALPAAVFDFGKKPRCRNLVEVHQAGQSAFFLSHAPHQTLSATSHKTRRQRNQKKNDAIFCRMRLNGLTATSHKKTMKAQNKRRELYNARETSMPQGKTRIAQSS